MLVLAQMAVQLDKTEIRLKFVGSLTGVTVNTLIADSSINAHIVTKLIMAFTIVEPKRAAVAAVAAVLALVTVDMKIVVNNNHLFYQNHNCKEKNKEDKQ